jgi:hypothetical protein
MKYVLTLTLLALIGFPRYAAAAQAPAPNVLSTSSANSTRRQQVAATADQSGTGSTAAEQPFVLIEHHGEVAMPASRLFPMLEGRFAGGWLGPYRVVHSDPRTRTLVIRRELIDPDSWTKWTYCKVGPIDMLDSLKNGTATVTIKLKPDKSVTITGASAQFAGTYGLGSSTKTVQCVSTGVLEDNLLATIAGEGHRRSGRVARR